MHERLDPLLPIELRDRKDGGEILDQPSVKMKRRRSRCC